MASLNDWLEGARLRTLPAAAAPILVGVGAASNLGSLSWSRSALALAVALFLQIGVNFSNDYSDGIRGTDKDRSGPLRLTASGKVPARTVLIAAVACFAAASAAGLALVIVSGTWALLGIGALSIVAAWFYTGGRNPYGYKGFGASELLVFVFFGLVATVGTTYVQTYAAPWWVWLAAAGIGFASVSLLMVNNLRDIPTDTVVGKRTIAVRLGDQWSRSVYMLLLVASIACGAVACAGAGASALWGGAIAGVLAICALPGVSQVSAGRTGAELIVVLRNTGLYALAYGVVVGAVFAIGAPLSL